MHSGTTPRRGFRRMGTGLTASRCLAAIMPVMALVIAVQTAPAAGATARAVREPQGMQRTRRTDASAAREPRTLSSDAARAPTIAPWDTVHTFSILGFDPATGEVGAAVQSRVFSVGNGVLWAEAGVGAVATQAVVDVSYGPQSMELLRKGVAPADIIKQVWDSDPDTRADWLKTGRQFAVMNAKGEVAAYTGPTATPWAGHKIGKFCSAQGNILASPTVVDSMVAAFERTPGRLALRLLAAIEAGQVAGGDKRGMQSAAMIVVKKDGGVWLHNDVVVRLQVDDNPEPIKELRRLVEIWARTQRRGG